MGYETDSSCLLTPNGVRRGAGGNGNGEMGNQRY